MRRTSLAPALLVLAPFVAVPTVANAAPTAPDSVGAQPMPPATDVPDDTTPPPPSDAAGASPTTGAAPTDAPQPAPTSTAGAPSRPPEVVVPGDTPDAPIPLERDTVGGHLTVSAAAGAIFPFGSFASNQPQSDAIGPGLWLSGDILYGVSRSIAIGAYGEYAMPSNEQTGSTSNWTTIAAGPLVRYHLVQGIPFDPWLSFGVGFRRTSDGNNAFTGMDWMRIQMGGDWYPFHQLGFGPLLEIAAGTFFGESNGSLGSKSVNAHFVVGGRIVFDAPGK